MLYLAKVLRIMVICLISKMITFGVNNRMKTVWSTRVYEVWGNSEDGYTVNGSFDNGNVELNIKTIKNNLGMSSEFISAYPSDYQIKKVFGIACKLDLQGDDTTIYINRERDGYPIGEMVCISHESLSPVRAVEGFTFENGNKPYYQYRKNFFCY